VSARLLLVAGTGQNGATILSRALGTLPGYVAIGEIGHLWDKGLIDGRECGCGLPFRACPFWRDVGAHAFGGWDRVDPVRITALRGSLLLRRLPVPHPFALPFILHPSWSRGYRRDLEEYRELMRRLYEGIAAVSGAEVIVDSMKVPAHVYAMGLDPGNDARVLHLVRDPRGVANSNQKVVKRQGADTRVRRSPLKAAARWTWINEAFRVLARRIPTDVLRYESFIADPRGTARAIAGFAGVPVDASDLVAIGDRSVEPGTDHLAAGNRSRFASGRIELRVDDAWTRDLSARQRRTVELVTRPWLARYGYVSGVEPSDR
jgi:Sulfotransferase family